MSPGWKRTFIDVIYRCFPKQSPTRDEINTPSYPSSTIKSVFISSQRQLYQRDIFQPFVTCAATLLSHFSSGQNAQSSRHFVIFIFSCWPTGYQDTWDWTKTHSGGPEFETFSFTIECTAAGTRVRTSESEPQSRSWREKVIRPLLDVCSNAVKWT